MKNRIKLAAISMAFAAPRRHPAQMAAPAL